MFHQLEEIIDALTWEIAQAEINQNVKLIYGRIQSVCDKLHILKLMCFLRLGKWMGLDRQKIVVQEQLTGLSKGHFTDRPMLNVTLLFVNCKSYSILK